MEKKQEIVFKTAITCNLPPKELRKMYTLMALSKYSYMLYPNYTEDTLLSLLKDDFKGYLTEAQSLMEQMPNNHSLHRIINFFENHYKSLITIIEQSK